MGEGAEIVISTDNNPNGCKLADAIETLTCEAAREALQVHRDLPPHEGRDWPEYRNAQVVERVG